MGYKLAGFDVVGGVEIDPQMMRIYRRNHEPDPRLSFEMPIGEFNRMFAERPIQELVGVDVLDGSPPCSTFSMVGSREEAWGIKRKFREGQAEQVLSDLFFEFIETVSLLRPKVVVAENVKGMLIGNARGYCSEVVSRLKGLGYDVQLFLLDASVMGVPQRRERVFFVARRSDACIPPIKMQFNEPVITLSKAFEGIDPYGSELTDLASSLWSRCPPGQTLDKVHPKKHWFTAYKCHPSKPFVTLTSSGGNSEGFMWDRPCKVSTAGHVRVQTFPDDFDFCGQPRPVYVLGMSVPPLMMQRIALVIARALLQSCASTSQT